MNQLIVSWSPVPNAGKRAAGTAGLWHFVPGEGATSTLCETVIPAKRGKVSHAEIDAADLRSLKGFCFICFHALCIERQDAQLWEVFERYYKLRDDLSSIRAWLQGIDGPESERNEALALFETFLHHTLVDSAIGGSEYL